MSSESNQFLSADDVVSNLWQEYTKTKEYVHLGFRLGIPKLHKCVIRREEEGLEIIRSRLENELNNTQVLYLEKLQNRNPSEWVREWSEWHKQLFLRVLKVRGRYREQDVRFGEVGDEELHGIPPHQLVGQKLAELALQISELLGIKNSSGNGAIKLMAKIHYGFIKVHPFPDGNGRIGRVIVDQISLAHGYPTIMGGYPRASLEQRKIYHEAIKECAINPECDKLCKWIEDKLNRTSKLITSLDFHIHRILLHKSLVNHLVCMA
ncbi:MAG: hypothetical protein A3A82_00425 [Candidatus Pacebacteria bacterium RIFCSPLOWO2_01_FULL_47_12]|nr:MAG: hypothetical protein A3J60_01470 [Candidatus Pacebacteria bacterium RIFCSPHIGHO2_02_FULL_46_9]OGJ39253.1 MAG: hypothetical protein A3A82_00425 [Candidatus Pacebacteria bacterium RIFCSPLOWO2_01_FULL_47_12]